MYKLDLEKGEESEIKLPTSVGSQKKQGKKKKKKNTSASLTMLKPLTVWITANCGKFLEIGIPDHLTCPLRNLYAGKEATVRTGHETTDQFKFGKGVCQAVYYNPDYLSYIQNTSCKMLGWITHKLEPRLP